MDRPGRNDPCPCGSGKKYKRCCLGKEAQREEFRREVTATALPLLRELGRFAAQRAGMQPEKIAAERFPFWRPPLSPAQAARLLEYLIFDYHVEKYGNSAAREFAVERAPLLPQPSQALLPAWIEAATQLYVIDCWSGGLAICTPAAAPNATPLEVLPLELAPEGTSIAAGKPAALRALAVGSRYIYPSWPIAFGDRAVEDVLEAVQARHHAFVRRERIVSFDEFLKFEPTAFDEEAAAGASTSRLIVPGR